MYNSELRVLIDTAYESADALDSSPFGDYIRKLGMNRTLKETLKIDLVFFISYLGSVTSKIADREVSFFRNYFDLPAGLREAKSMCSTSFVGENYSSKVPFSFQLFVMSDKILPQMGLDTNGRGSRFCLSLFLNIGQQFITYYGDPDSKELQAFNEIILQLENYRNQELGNSSNESNNDPLHPSSSESSTPSKEESLDTLLNELDSLVGMEQVKQDVHSLINLMRIREIRKQRGLPQNNISLHMVFTGNPGTGKTTVARLISKIYKNLGVLSKGHLVEVDRSGLVAGYVGQTALKVQERITESRGGVLFIDEAYALTVNRDGSDFGFEAVDTLLKGMEDYRDDFVVIVAGYPEPMIEFLESNPGLKSRFNRFIHFDDYTPDELLSILLGMCKKSGYNVPESAFQLLHTHFARMYEMRDNNFANGRDVRNLYEKAVLHQANRLTQYSELSDDDLVTLCESDFQNAITN